MSYIANATPLMHCSFLDTALNARPMKKPWRVLVIAPIAGMLIGGVAAAAGADDRAAAEATLKEVEASPQKAVAAEMTTRAKAALDRASKLRGSGDEPHARLAD